MSASPAADESKHDWMHKNDVADAYACACGSILPLEFFVKHERTADVDHTMPTTTVLSVH